MCWSTITRKWAIFFPQTFSVCLWNAGPSIWVLNQHLLLSYFKSQSHEWQRKRKFNIQKQFIRHYPQAARLAPWCQSEDALDGGNPSLPVVATPAWGWDLAFCQSAILSKAYGCYFLIYSSREGAWPIKPNDHRFPSQETVSYKESRVMNLFSLLSYF